MAEKTNSQINEENLTTIDALGTYLDYVAPVEQFGSNFLGRIGKIQPIKTQEDLVERGLIGADGLLTPQGDLFKTLNDNKFINQDGTLSEKSTAFLMDEDDALRPENLNAWRIRKENKIGETPMSWGDTFGSLGELLWDAGVGLGTMVKLGVQNVTQQDPDTVISNLKSSGITLDEEKVRETLQKQSDQLLNKSSVAATSFVENSIKAFSETGALIDLGGAWALSLPSRLLGDAENATELVDTARQFQDRVIKSNQDAAIGSTLDAVFQTATYVDEMARVKAEMPKAEFDQTIKQTAAAGQIFADPMEMAKIGTVLRLSTKPIVSRLTLNAERVIGKAAATAARLAQIDVDIADVERAKGMAQNAAELAKRTGDAARERFDLNGDQNLLRRANTAEDIFNRSSAQVGRFTDDGIRLADEAAQLTADSQRLAARIPVAAAQSYEAAAKAGRGLKALPFKTFSAIVEPVGRGIVALDDGLDSVSKKLGIGAAYDILTSKVGQAVGYGAAVGLGPVPAVIGAAGSVLKSGPFLQRLADTSRIMGTEMAKAQSQIPFFQRVANNPMISPAHRSLAHLADAATLGGFLPNISRRAVKGAALSFPLDFAAQYMSDGGEVNQNTFKQAVAESVLIGGSSASLGGMFAGTKRRHKELSVNDEINFRNEITAPDQKALFTQAPSGIRRAIGTFSAVFPSVNIELTESGGGFHDDNTIGIDLNSSNPLKYLLAHEVKHLLVHRNQMHLPIVAMMLGDGETGGLMRSPDGTLNPEFEAFSKEYNSRQIASGRQPVSLGKLAEEFFVEAGVEDMARITESGELGAIASRTEARRMIGRLFNGVFDKSTVLKDFHLRIGGLMDQGGKLVQGSGLLESGLTQTQEMRNMTRNMLSRAAGRSVGAFQPLGASNVGDKGEGPGINLPINPGDKAMIEKIGPVEFEMETVNGQRQVARDSNGDPIPLDFNTQLMRSRTGSLVQEAIGNRPSTYQSSPGEMRLNDEGVWEGYLSPDLLEYIKRKGSLAPEQIRMVEHVNSMIKNFKGDVAVVINHPATGRNRKGKLNYKTLKSTLRQVTPISWTISKDGNLMLGLMSVTQLKSNIDSRISSKLGQKLYQGNRAKLMIDIGKVMELHQKGKRTDAYFDKEYGAAKSEQFKNFVNSVFGLITKKQGEANPIFSQENLSGNGVYKTYRADRVSQATKITGDKYPFQYDFVVQNMMPNGLPTLDEQGRPVAQNRLPEPIDKKLQNEITQLQNQIDGMYESGMTDGVEDLEARLETLLEKSDTDLAAMEIENMEEFDSANPSPEERLVNSWYRWTGKGLPDESADLKTEYKTFGAFARAMENDVIGKVKDVGTIGENITDKQIEQAAKESAAAYEKRRDALKSNRKYSVIDPLTLNRLPEPLRQMPEPGAKLQPVSIAEFKRTASREDVIAVNKALKYISSLGREHPESVQLRIQTDKNGIPKLDTLVDSDGVPILDSKGREQRGVVFSQESYKLRSAPRLSTNDATARKQASALLEADARAALEHPDSLTGLGWYSRMRKFLQRQLGSNIEVFGQLLGATSARTPVDANFRQTLEAIREFSSGAYDDLLQRYHQHVESVKQDAASGELKSEWTKKYESWREMNPKSAKKKYVEADEIRKKINAFDDVPLRPNGKKFNANSKKVLQALYGNWIEQTVGPKTPNFAGNLTGRTLKATIDVWAARNLRRLLYQGKMKKWRILPEQEKGVDDVDFSFGQDVFNDVAEKLGMNADDLQALMWFHEKGIWAENNWTNTVGGKKSSFDEEANKLSLDRYQAGITTFTDSTRFDPSLQDAERKRIQTSIAALDGLVASRVTHSNGLYGDVVEPSFDVEFSIKRNNDGTSKSVSTVIDQLIDIAKNQSHRQMDTFVSQVVDDTHPNARPMVEIGFKSPASKADIDAVTNAFKNLGIDGFTVAKDQRGNVIGIRSQYIPEISARYDTPDHLVAEKFLENADKWMNNAESALIEAKKINNVSYTEQGHVSTTVYGTEEYDTATPTDISRTLRETELGRRKEILEQNAGPDNSGSDPVTGFSNDAGRSDSSGNVPAD
jgi:hypothetical protein